MKQDIEIRTVDGTAGAAVIKPENGAAPDRGVIIYMDAFGPREALYQMGQRIADAGHVVLVPDLYYRSGSYEPFDAKTAFSDEATKTKLRGMMQATSQELTARDGAAFIDALTREGATGAIGTVGYCMGGARALTAAARYPDRIRAAASFHGGNLASDAEDSPHRLADKIKARVYVGVAGVDNSFPPEQSARLAEALRIGGVDHTIENYVGMAHGWTVPDHGVYDRTGSERHFKRLLTLLEEAL
ncbi:dienelactone hydrolase family protein [Neorhizobium sp. CSC1952]|uniref:dienelactone hydrolase family protein n=1 Tax=Neorhizobium sp. CSC1952 TaxID=2978974 RepID=UPI0025A5A31C|nr:dienelactone hydrolase family protein [Rhizobium sp. CSC1952]WJR65648.1 dienelactone hydrolase family protein [Rhizobium sp. CSC1952]